MTRTPGGEQRRRQHRSRLVGQRHEDDVGFVRERLLIEGVSDPFQTRFNAGSRRAADAALDDVASVSRTDGWRARMRSSSWPV